MQIVSRSADLFAASAELGEDRVGGSGPGEVSAVLVVVSDKVIDLGDQILDRAEGASAASLSVLSEKKCSTRFN